MEKLVITVKVSCYWKEKKECHLCLITYISKSSFRGSNSFSTLITGKPKNTKINYKMEQRCLPKWALQKSGNKLFQTSLVIALRGWTSKSYTQVVISISLTDHNFSDAYFIDWVCQSANHSVSKCNQTHVYQSGEASMKPWCSIQHHTDCTSTWLEGHEDIHV